MRFLDKVLLLLLVVLLPLGVFLSSKYLNDPLSGGDRLNQNPATAEKIDKLIDDLSRIRENAAPSPAPAVQITGTTYASKSATLTLAGIAPRPGAALRVSWVEISDEAIIPELGAQVGNDAMVLTSTNLKALMPRNDGSFSLQIPVTLKHGVVAIWLQQLTSTVTLQYDLDTQKWTD